MSGSLPARGTSRSWLPVAAVPRPPFLASRSWPAAVPRYQLQGNY